MNLVMLFSGLIAVEALALLAVTFSPDHNSRQPRASIKRTADEAALLPGVSPVALTAR